MNELMPYIWIGIIVFAALAEIYTLTLVAVWFIPSSVASFVLSLTGLQVWEQVFIFFIVTLILLILSRTVFRKFTKYKTLNPNSDLLVGKSAIVTQEINNYQNTGTVRINGLEWEAKTEEDDIIYESGLVVIVVGLDGATAVCSR